MLGRQAEHFSCGRQRQQAVYEKPRSPVVPDGTKALGVRKRTEVALRRVLDKEGYGLRTSRGQGLHTVRLHHLHARHVLTMEQAVRRLQTAPGVGLLGQTTAGCGEQTQGQLLRAARTPSIARVGLTQLLRDPGLVFKRGPRGVERRSAASLHQHSTLRKRLCRGYNQMSLMGRIGRWTRDFLPRPVVCPTRIQLAAL